MHIFIPTFPFALLSLLASSGVPSSALGSGGRARIGGGPVLPVEVVSNGVEFTAFLLIVVLVVKTVIEVDSKRIVFLVLLHEVVQLTSQQGLHIGEDLDL